MERLLKILSAVAAVANQFNPIIPLPPDPVPAVAPKNNVPAPPEKTIFPAILLQIAGTYATALTNVGDVGAGADWKILED